MALSIGSRIAHYDVTALIGEGGMGQVYQATDTKLNRQVALKVLPESLRHDPQACRRFEREARSAAALDHPFICKIYEVLDANGDSCIAMEYVVGETVQARLERGALTPQEALLISKEVAEALEEAHRHDLPPLAVPVLMRELGSSSIRSVALG